MTSTPGMVLAGGAARESIYSSSISKIGRSLVSKSYYLYDGLNEEENFSFDLRAFLIERGYDKVGRVFGGEIINDYALLTSMLRFGGFQAVVFNRRMKSVVRHYKGQLADSLTSASSVIHQYYSSQLYAYEHALVHGRDAKMPEIPHLTRPRAGADPVRNRQGSVAPDIEPSVPQVSALPVPLPKPLRPLALKPLGNGVTSSLLKFAKSSPHVNASNGSTPHSKRLPIIVPCPPLLLPAPKEMAGSSTGCNLKKVGNSHNQDQLRSKLKVFAPSLVDVVRAANRDRVLWRPAVAGSGGDSDVRRQCRAIVYTSRRDVAIGHEVVASISGVALSELKPWLDGQFEGNTSVIEARVRNFLILYCGGLLNHLLPGNAGLLTHDELQEMYPWNVGVSGTPSAHIAVTTSIVAPDPPAVRTRGDRVGGSDRPVVARKTSLSTPPGVGECMPSPVAPGNRSGIHVRPHRSNSDIVKPRLAKSQKSKSKTAARLREMMRSNPEVSLQFLERQTALSAAVIEQFLNGSMTSETHRAGSVMRSFLIRLEGIVSKAMRSRYRGRRSGQKRARDSTVPRGSTIGWERCAIPTGPLVEPLPGLLAPPPSPSRE